MHRSARSLFLLAIGSAALMLQGCSYRLRIQVEERSGSVRFHFKKPQPFARTTRISEFGVYRRGVSDWEYRAPLWTFEAALGPGDFRELASVDYGDLPRSFSEEAPAAGLNAGEIYLACASGDGGGGCQKFTLNHDINPPL